MISASDHLVLFSIPALAVLMVALSLALLARARQNVVRATIIVAAVMAGEFMLAGSGVLQHWTLPPPFILMMIPVTMLTVRTAFSGLGRAMTNSLPIFALAGVQCFRLPLELVMHHAANTGVMPSQMTYTGWNFDIITGVGAIGVAGLSYFGLAPRGLVLVFNSVGSLLLVVVVSLAVASTPVFAAFGPDKLNTWVTAIPYVWLPGVLVEIALFFHILLWRKLLATAANTSPTVVTAATSDRAK